MIMKEKTLKRTDLVASRHINIEKDSLPVDVRPSEKSLLKLPYTFIGASELEVLQAIYNRNTFFCDGGVSKTRGRGPGRGRGRVRSLSFFKECCSMIRVRARVDNNANPNPNPKIASF